MDKIIFKTEFFDVPVQNLINGIPNSCWSMFILYFRTLCEKLEETKDRDNVYVVEGSIAAGKTTLLNNLRNKGNKEIHIILEPVDIWQDIGIIDKDTNKFINILELFYLAKVGKKDKIHIFLFQVIVLLSRVQRMIHKLELYNDEDKIVIMERHPLSDK